MRAGRLPYGGAKGGVAFDPTKLSRTELEAVSRRYTQEMIPFIGPQTDIMGPDMGTNEQIMAWMMDTYSVHMGYAVNEIVTGKPVAIGGTQGRREATGRGVVYLVKRAMNMLKMDPEKCTAIVQGSATSVPSQLFRWPIRAASKLSGSAITRLRFTIRKELTFSRPSNT